MLLSHLRSKVLVQLRSYISLLSDDPNSRRYATWTLTVLDNGVDEPAVHFQLDFDPSRIFPIGRMDTVWFENRRKTKSSTSFGNMSGLRPPYRRLTRNAATFVERYLGVKVQRIYRVPSTKPSTTSTIISSGLSRGRTEVVLTPCTPLDPPLHSHCRTASSAFPSVHLPPAAASSSHP